MTEFDRGQRVATRALTEDSVNMDFLLHDPLEQTVTYQRVTFDAQGTTLRPLRLRYCWPSELDLMAQLAGMRLMGALQRLGLQPVHRGEPQARLGLRAGLTAHPLIGRVGRGRMPPTPGPM